MVRLKDLNAWHLVPVKGYPYRLKVVCEPSGMTLTDLRAQMEALRRQNPDSICGTVVEAGKEGVVFITLEFVHGTSAKIMIDAVNAFEPLFLYVARARAEIVRSPVTGEHLLTMCRIDVMKPHLPLGIDLDEVMKVEGVDIALMDRHHAYTSLVFGLSEATQNPYHIEGVVSLVADVALLHLESGFFGGQEGLVDLVTVTSDPKFRLSTDFDSKHDKQHGRTWRNTS